MNLLDLLFGAWMPPVPSRSKRYRLLGGNKNKGTPIFARVKIMSVLTNEWKTNKEIAQETGLQLNTVQQKTARLFLSGKIEKTTLKMPDGVKPSCLYKIKHDK